MALTRQTSRVFVGAILALAASVAFGAPDAHRKVGLWEQRLTLDDGGYQIPPSQICLDADAERRMTLVGAQMDRGSCGAYRLQRQADGSWAFSSTCSLSAGARVTTIGRVVGDLASAYTITATGVTAGAARPEQNGEHRIVVEARWLGACPAERRGGDVTSSGKTYNVFAPKP